MPLHLDVDVDACQGHALCYFQSETLFAIGESDGKAAVLVDPLPDNLRNVAEGAVDACPERAISLRQA